VYCYCQANSEASVSTGDKGVVHAGCPSNTTVHVEVRHVGRMMPSGHASLPQESVQLRSMYPPEVGSITAVGGVTHANPDAL